jgi:hypothetical protein
MAVATHQGEETGNMAIAKRMSPAALSTEANQQLSKAEVAEYKTKLAEAKSLTERARILKALDGRGARAG